MKDTYVNNSTEVGFKALHILLSVSDICFSNAGFPCKSFKSLTRRMVFNEVVLRCLQLRGHAALVREH